MSDFDVPGTVGKLALPTFARFQIYGNPTLGPRDMVPRTGAAGCFWLADQLVASQEDSARKRGNVGGKIPEFSAKPYFVDPFSCAWPCTEASLGSQDMILRTEAVGVFLMPRVQCFNHVNSLVSSRFFRMVKSGLGSINGPNQVNGHGSNLVNSALVQQLGLKLMVRLYNHLSPVSRRVFMVSTGAALTRTFGSNLVHKSSGQKPNGKSPSWSNRSTVHQLGLSGIQTGQPWSNVDPDEVFWVVIGGVMSLSSDQADLVRAASFCVLTPEKIPGMSDRGSGSGGHRRSDRLAKSKAVVYAPESSPDTDDEYDAMEDVRTRADASIARNLQAELDAEATGLVSSAARPPSRPGVVIGHSARPSGTTRPSPQPSVTTGHSDTPSNAPRCPHTRSTGVPPSRLKRQRAEGIPDSAGAIPEDYVAPRFRYPPQGGIRPRYPVIVEISDTPLLTNLLAHSSSLVHRCQDPPESVGRGGWSEFSRLLAISRQEYREFLIEVGFGPFLGIPYVSVYHPSVGCFVERFFHHTGTFHLSTCEMAVLPVDWSAILGIRFAGRAPPSELISGPEAKEILGLDDRDAIDGTRLPSVRVRYLADILRRDREEPPTELRYCQWAAYFIFSCFLRNDKSTIPTPIIGMFRDIGALREYDWGALTYGFYIRGLRRYSRRESISFLGFWQFTIFWAFEHFPTFAPSRLPLASDPDFPLARRWDSSRIRRMTSRTLSTPAENLLFFFFLFS
uniref:Aminotransferase-like plant mobile domain-containing protein n=1 Tax=Fagus sylvatica TaxID=28930 RepID=A0A2N9G6H3_FAGSY